MASWLIKAPDLWRELGPRRFAIRVGRKVKERVEQALETQASHAVSDAEFHALVPDVDALWRRLPAFAISPWLQPEYIHELPDDAQADLLARAERVLAHAFTVLGTGPHDLGVRIDWLADPATGRRWPAVYWRKVVISYPDASDIKRVWELSRFHHLPLLGQAWWLTGDERYSREAQAQIESWLQANPVAMGPNWACPMEVAIRAVNWLYGAMALADSWDGAFRKALAKSLYEHGRFIRRHLEWGEVRGNHYLADLVGLLFVGALFCDVEEGSGWWEYAYQGLIGEMDHQVHPDGLAHEASIPYHRLVTELFAAAEALAYRLERPFPPEYLEGLDRMRRAVQWYLRPDGTAPTIGDDDSGRLHVLADYGASNPGDHRHLFTDYDLPVPDRDDESHAFYDAGLYVMRDDQVQLTIHAGDTGLRGLGPHGHCDQLAFELVLGHQPLILDAGTWAYTGDPAGRNRFRSTASHATLRVDGQEQNPFRPEILFAMPDATRSECLTWQESEELVRFVGRHYGYTRLAEPVLHVREIVLARLAGRITIEDRLEGSGDHELEWFFPLADLGWQLLPDGSCQALLPDGRTVIVRPIDGPPLAATLDDSEWSPAYGVKRPGKRLCYAIQAAVPLTVRFEVAIR